MTNIFMKVNKDLFKLKLNPTEILIIAQVMEFQTNTNDCFISNKVLAEQFGVSEKTISRAVEALEQRGFITRNTKNVKGGKERHMRVNLDKIEEELTKDNLSVVNDEPQKPQRTNCPLTTDKMSLVKGQNDIIKDNGIDNLKDNYGKIEEPAAPSIFLTTNEEAEKPKAEVKSSFNNPIKVSREWLVERYNHSDWSAYETVGVFKWHNDGNYYKVVC